MTFGAEPFDQSLLGSKRLESYAAARQLSGSELEATAL